MFCPVALIAKKLTRVPRKKRQVNRALAGAGHVDDIEQNGNSFSKRNEQVFLGKRKTPDSKKNDIITKRNRTLTDMNENVPEARFGVILHGKKIKSRTEVSTVVKNMVRKKNKQKENLFKDNKNNKMLNRGDQAKNPDERFHALMEMELNRNDKFTVETERTENEICNRAQWSAVEGEIEDNNDVEIVGVTNAAIGCNDKLKEAIEDSTAEKLKRSETIKNIVSCSLPLQSKPGVERELQMSGVSKTTSNVITEAKENFVSNSKKKVESELKEVGVSGPKKKGLSKAKKNDMSETDKNIMSQTKKKVKQNINLIEKTAKNTISFPGAKKAQKNECPINAGPDEKTKKSMSFLLNDRAKSNENGCSGVELQTLEARDMCRTTTACEVECPCVVGQDLDSVASTYEVTAGPTKVVKINEVAVASTYEVTAGPTEVVKINEIAVVQEDTLNSNIEIDQFNNRDNERSMVDMEIKDSALIPTSQPIAASGKKENETKLGDGKKKSSFCPPIRPKIDNSKVFQAPSQKVTKGETTRVEKLVNDIQGPVSQTTNYDLDLHKDQTFISQLVQGNETIESLLENCKPHLNKDLMNSQTIISLSLDKNLDMVVESENGHLATICSAAKDGQLNQVDDIVIDEDDDVKVVSVKSVNSDELDIECDGAMIQNLEDDRSVEIPVIGSVNLKNTSNIFSLITVSDKLTAEQVFELELPNIIEAISMVTEAIPVEACVAASQSLIVDSHFDDLIKLEDMLNRESELVQSQSIKASQQMKASQGPGLSQRGGGGAWCSQVQLQSSQLLQSFQTPQTSQGHSQRPSVACVQPIDDFEALANEECSTVRSVSSPCWLRVGKQKLDTMMQMSASLLGRTKEEKYSLDVEVYAYFLIQICCMLTSFSSI